MQGSSGSKPRSGLDGVVDHLVGPDASFTERVLVVGAALGLTAATLLTAGEWTTLQYAVAALVALDLGGGVVANATQSAKLWFHRDERSTLRRFAFVTGHVHPFVLSVVFAPIDALYGGVVYACVVAVGAFILWTPNSLKRPVAFTGVTALVVLDQLYFTLPDALGWFIPVFSLKLLVGHLVPEGRPAP